jgi:hypothetical protein
MVGDHMAAKQDGGSVLRRMFRPVKIVLSVVFVLTGALVAFSPLPSFASPSAAAGKTTSVPIPLGKACEWAYPGQSNGRYSGSGKSIVCLGKKGQVLGGFKKSHSLSAWCANSRHTDGRHLPTPALVKGVWVCTVPASGHRTGPSGSFTTPTAGADINAGNLSASGTVRNLPPGYRLDLFLKFADLSVYYVAGDPNTTVTIAGSKWSGRIGVGSHAPTTIYIYLVELSPASVRLMNSEVSYQNNGFPSITALGTILARVQLNLS